ncbi:MAG: AraC family transcriptional regulator [Cyanobacteria bacterium P01_D01_bin.56]
MSSHYKFAFTNTDFQEMLGELQQQAGTQEIGARYQVEGNESAWRLQKSFGTWSGHAIDLRDGLDLSLVDWDIQEDLSLTSEAPMGSLFGLSFCVAGGFTTKFYGKTADQMARANEVYAGFFPNDVKSVTEFTAGQKATLVQVRVSSHLLEALESASPDSSQATLKQILAVGLNWQTCKTTPAMMLALHQILNCPYEGLTRRFYLESKTLELIALQLDQLSQHRLELPATSTLKANDIARVYLARDILIRDLENPPSSVALAKQAGINSLKLKQGFRQIFNTTVFGYLYAYRMEEARRLLEQGGSNVTQVAQRVGYAHPGKFAAAFKKKFGISPKVLKSC